MPFVGAVRDAAQSTIRIDQLDGKCKMIRWYLALGLLEAVVGFPDLK